MKHATVHTTTSAADTVGVTRQAILKAIKQGRLKAEQVGSTWIIHDDDLGDYIAARNTIHTS